MKRGISMTVAELVGQEWAMRADRLSAFDHGQGQDQGAEVVLAHYPIDLPLCMHEVLGDAGVKACGPQADNTATPEYFNVGGVALIPITGVMMRSDEEVQHDGVWYGTSQERIRRVLAATERDEAVQRRVLVVDSPGGLARGMDALAAEVRASAAIKGLVTYIASGAHSAAYWLASATQRIVTERDGAAGSIGTYVVAYDTSKMLDKMGVTAHLVSSGGTKGVGAFGVPLTDDYLTTLKESVVVIQGLFNDGVATGRKISIEAARELASGREWIGMQAVKVGLVDSIGSLGALVRTLAADINMGGEGGGLMSATTAAATKDGDDMRTSILLLSLGAAAAGTVDPSGGGGGGAGFGAGLSAKSPSTADVLLAERTRVSELTLIADAFSGVEGVSEYVKAAAQGDTTADRARKEVMALVAKSRTPAAAGPTVEVGAEQGDKVREALSLVMACKASPGIETMLTRHERDDPDRGDRVAQNLGFDNREQAVKALRVARADGLARYRLIDIAEACALGGLARIGGGRGRWANDDAMLAAIPGHSGADFPLLLSNLANKVLQAGMAEQPSTWQEWCGVDSSSDFKTKTTLAMSDAGGLLLVPDGDNVRQASVNERREESTLQTYGRGFKIGRQMVYNDDLSAFARLPALWGMAAQRIPEDLAYQVLTANANMSDGVALFHATHGNLPTPAVLSMASLFGAATAMMTQRGFGTDASKIELDIKPTHLLVPTNLRGTASVLYDSKTDPTSGEANSKRMNEVFGLAKPVASSRLFRASTTAWYLVSASPANPLVVVSFLNGSRVPTINQISSGSILNTEWEIIFDCSAKSINHEAGVRGN